MPESDLDKKRRTVGHTLILLTSSFLFMLTSVDPVRGQASGPPRSFDSSASIPMTDFSALEGVWQVESHSLRRRMIDEKEWLENHMETRFRILLGGLVAINDTYGTFSGNPMHGMMIRTYDPDLDEWRFQWMSEGFPHLTEQVRGRFTDGIGVFLGKEVNEGRTFDMRFRWKKLEDDHFFWEQSYQNADTGNWIVNWTLEFTKKPDTQGEG